MTQERYFDISDILSVAAGNPALSTRGEQGYQELTAHLLGDSGFSTIGGLTKADVAQAVLKGQFPWLQNVEPPVFSAGISAEQKQIMTDDFVMAYAIAYGSELNVRERDSSVQLPGIKSIGQMIAEREDYPLRDDKPRFGFR